MIRITINADIPERWLNDFFTFLKRMEANGSVGNSEMLGFFSDGQGDFKPKFEFVGCMPRYVEAKTYDVQGQMQVYYPESLT